MSEVLTDFANSDPNLTDGFKLPKEAKTKAYIAWQGYNYSDCEKKRKRYKVICAIEKLELKRSNNGLSLISLLTIASEQKEHFGSKCWY